MSKSGPLTRRHVLKFPGQYWLTSVWAGGLLAPSANAIAAENTGSSESLPTATINQQS